jgi:NAD-dependent DNA ligase
MTNDDIKALIRRRRAQMLVHSYLYYEADDPIISDDLWQQWANELEELQRSYPKCCKLEYYDKEFQDWDGTTGNHLPRTIIIEGLAKQVRRSYDKVKSEKT